jgi:hypothetical protein
MASDHVLDHFRVEYEKLHSALVHFHDRNHALTERCRQMNLDILSNSNKIATIIQMSHEDQRTMSTLRTEIQREARAREVILTLKTEIENLSTLVAQSNDISGMQNTSIQESLASIAALRAEIANQEAQIMGLIEHLDVARIEEPILTGEIGPLGVEERSAVVEIEAVEDDLQEMGSDQINIENDIAIVKQEVQNFQGETVRLDTELGVVRERLVGIQKLLREKDLDRRMLTDEIQQRKARIAERSEVLMKRKQRADARQTLVESIEKQIADGDVYLKSLREEECTIGDRIAHNQREFSEVRAERDAITRESLDLYHNIGDMRQLVPQLQKKRHDIELAKIMTHVTIERQYRVGRDMAAECAQETVQAQAQVQNNEVAKRDLTNAKQDRHAEREISFEIETDLQEDAHNIALITTSYNQHFDEAFELHKRVDEATLKLAHLDDKMHRQNALTASTHFERDMVIRRLEKQNRENDAITEDIELLRLMNNHMKHEIRDRDRELVDQRLETCQIADGNAKMEAAAVHLEHKIADLSVKIEKTVDELRFHYHTNDEMVLDLDALHLNRINSIDELKRLGWQNANRATECLLLRAKIRLLSDEFRMKAAKFEEKLNEIRCSELDFSNALRRESQLILKRKRADLLQTECNRLDKMWMRTSTQVIVLEQKAERPTNVHRWRLLPSAEPQLFLLFQLRSKLVNDIETRRIILKRLQSEVAELKAEMVEHEQTLSRSPTESSTDSTGVVQALNQRDVVLKTLKAKVASSMEVCTEKRKVKAVREAIQQSKLETTENYQIISELRASIQVPGTPSVKRAPGRVRMAVDFRSERSQY